VDAVAPAIIGIGIYLMYEAWKSHQTGNPPTPVAKIKGAITGASSTTPATTTTGG
jgi:hypothetical protein